MDGWAHTSFLHNDVAVDQLFEKDWPNRKLQSRAVKANLRRYLVLREYGPDINDTSFLFHKHLTVG
jgi:hypothetical protein